MIEVVHDGEPKVDGPDMTITFATGSETNPRDRGKRPACLAEWGRKK